MKIQNLEGFGCSFEHYMQDHGWVDGPCTKEALLEKTWAGQTGGEGSLWAVRVPCSSATPKQAWPSMAFAWETKNCCLPFWLKLYSNRCLTSKTCSPVFAHQSVVQMASFWPSVPLSFFVLLKTTIRRQKRKSDPTMSSGIGQWPKMLFLCTPALLGWVLLPEMTFVARKSKNKWD